MNEPLALCTILILAVTAVATFQGFRDPSFAARLIFDPEPILRDREYHRLLTSALLHADWVHFAFNAFSFYSFGKGVELNYGLSTLLFTYLGSILGGSLLSLFLHRHHEYRALGASGGVCGVIFASIFLLPGGSIYMFFIPVPIPYWLFAILFIVISFVALRRQRDNIGHDAHLGGAIFGLLITAGLYPVSVTRSLGLFLAVLGLSVAGLLYLVFNPLFRPVTNPLDRWRERAGTAREIHDEDRREEEEREMDALLDKVSKSGMDSLSARELNRLQMLSKRRRSGG